MTVDIQMTEVEARRITERIRTALDRFSTSWADLAERVGEAYERRADLALGYGSWAEYASAEFKPAEGLAASVRQQVVGLLSAQGMSTRAIAPVVGVSNFTVSKDRQVLGDLTPETGRIATTDGVVVAEVEHHDLTAETIDFATGEVITDQRGGAEPPSPESAVEEQGEPAQPPAPRPAVVVGLDGKSYPRPTPAARRRPITDQARDAGWELRKAVERVERIAQDDRFVPNELQVAPHLRGHLQFAIQVCQDLLDRIDHNTKE